MHAFHLNLLEHVASLLSLTFNSTMKPVELSESDKGNSAKLLWQCRPEQGRIADTDGAATTATAE